ncbi:MAG: SIMPL domain-containing protein [Thermoguttaceae bacterium]
MKRIDSLALALVVWALAATGHTAALAHDTDNTQPSITVSGEAVVYVVPNKILISLGVEDWDAKLFIAKQKNDETIKRAIASILAQGIEKKAIQTDEITIEPTYPDHEPPYRARAINGYWIRNSLTVTVEKVGMVEKLIAAALSAGVNQIHNIDFQTTELRKHRDKARELALKAAREKARDMATVLGQAVGKPLRINENGGLFGYYGGWCRWGRSNRDYYALQNSFMEAPHSPNSGDDTGAVALGKIGVRANVSVTFELKDQ